MIFRSRKYRLVISLFMATLLWGGLQVWLAHSRIENNHATQRLQVEIASVRQTIQTLKLELASLTRPESLRQLAKKKLGMRPPLPLQVIRP